MHVHMDLAGLKHLLAGCQVNHEFKNNLRQQTIICALVHLSVVLWRMHMHTCSHMCIHISIYACKEIFNWLSMSDIDFGTDVDIKIDIFRPLRFSDERGL